VCDRSSGECECFPGYEGRGCRRQKCPNDCSGNGRCIYNSAANSTYVAEGAAKFGSQFWDAGMTRVCACDRGWQGYDCSTRICPKGDDPVTDCATGGHTDANSASHNMVQRLFVQTYKRLDEMVAGTCDDNTSTTAQACTDGGGNWTANDTGCIDQTAQLSMGLQSGWVRSDQVSGFCHNTANEAGCPAAGGVWNGAVCVKDARLKADCTGTNWAWTANQCNPMVVITTAGGGNAVNSDLAGAKFNFYGYISLKYTDMFGGEYFTRPILIDTTLAATQNTKLVQPTVQWATTKDQMYQTSASAPGTGLLRAEGSCSVSAQVTQLTCENAGGVWTASVTGFHLGGTATTTHATISQDRMKTSTLKRFTADRIRHALQDLPNFVIPSVNVTNFVDAGYSVWGNVFDITFTDETTSGKQHLLECVFDSARGCDGAQPKMKSVTVPTNTKTTTTGTSQVYTVGGTTQMKDCKVVEVPLTGTNTYEENSECSNRGLCDASSGICDCFAGHTGEACSTQTIFF
jgi:hypothetical protein